MPVPDAVHVRVRATDCRRNLVGGMLRRALTRAVNMAAVRGGRTGDGFGGRPARPLRRQPRATPGDRASSITPRSPIPRRSAPCSGSWTATGGPLPVRCALRLVPLLFVRPGELHKAEWAGIDLEGAEWRYTVTKTGTPHVVPLARQAVAILREVHSLTGHGRYVFPNARYPHRERPMSHATLWSTFRALDIPRDRMTLHGFRAMARTILDEVLGFRPDFIEHQLAHAVRDPNGRAYNRTAFLPERRVVMQAWADYLDQLRAGEAAAARPTTLEPSR